MPPRSWPGPAFHPDPELARRHLAGPQRTARCAHFPPAAPVWLWPTFCSARTSCRASFCDTWQLTRQLAEAAQQGQNCKVDSSQFPETNRFLSDVRYLIGAVAVPQGAPIFRWNEKDGSKESALAAWQKQGNPNLEPLLPGCAGKCCCPTPTTPPAATPTATRGRSRWQLRSPSCTPALACSRTRPAP